MSAMMRGLMNVAARQFIHAPVDYTFTEREKMALKPFFSNIDKKVFFIHHLPASVYSALLAMYSRLKNPRGLRGHFVDHLVPLLMHAPSMFLEGRDIGDWKKMQAGFKKAGLTTLDKICEHESAYQISFDWFLEASGDPEYWTKIANADRIREFLSMWLDSYGHNSIARPADFVIGIEDISILAAKSLEWGRPGAAYIELSTRYVDFSGKSQYPIWNELAPVDMGLAVAVRAHIEARVEQYRTLIGSDFDGPFPVFLRDYWTDTVGADNIKAGVIGESCDVLGNLLPCTTLTSLGISVSGEAFPELLKHLYLDDTPENDALAELIIAEAEGVGAGHFARHLEISEWRRADWSYLTPSKTCSTTLPLREFVETVLFRALRATERYATKPFNTIIDVMASLERFSHDKLPAQFEHITTVFGGTMSFRGWRDLQRMGMSTHHRSRVTPLLGYYTYPKPAPPELAEAFRIAHQADTDVWLGLLHHNIPPLVRQYAMTMGELVSYTIAGNLRQNEFCNWQRSKWGVNDEVRSEFLSMEELLRERYPWWSRLSRADITPHYVFARGASPVVLP
jgi:thymidylate synthase ThyX